MSEQLLRLRTVLGYVPLSKSSLYSRISAGEFPPPIHIGRRAVAWKKSDVDRWVNLQIEKSGLGTPAELAAAPTERFSDSSTKAMAENRRAPGGHGPHVDRSVAHGE